MFRSKASSLLRLVLSNDEDDIEIELEKVAHQIVRDVNESVVDDKTIIPELIWTLPLTVSVPLCYHCYQSFLQNWNHTLPVALIGNIGTNVISGRFTTLQIALGIVLNRKGLIEQFYDFLVSRSCDEVLLFKPLVAAAAVSNASLRGNAQAKDSLVQLVSDNFEA